MGWITVKKSVQIFDLKDKKNSMIIKMKGSKTTIRQHPKNSNEIQVRSLATTTFWNTMIFPVLIWAKITQGNVGKTIATLVENYKE